jgi:hypothetical protein
MGRGLMALILLVQFPRWRFRAHGIEKGIFDCSDSLICGDLRHNSTVVRVIFKYIIVAKLWDSDYRGMCMSLIYQIRPFLNLGVCKEYGMPRKTITTRSKKTAGLVAPAAVQIASEIGQEVPREAPKNGKQANIVSSNLEDQIRRRAYELYLERRATAGSDSGNQHQDWLMAEREIRARLGGHDQAFGAAAGQIRS